MSRSRTGSAAANDARTSARTIMKRKYHDLPKEFHADFLQVKPYTMVRAARSHALWEAVNYVCRAGIQGCFVECGVWRGGQAMLAALAFTRNQCLRELHLYDTFAGMPKPTEHDIRGRSGTSAMKKWAAHQTDDHNEWAYAPLEDVRANMVSTDYPADKVNYHVGVVEQTLTQSVPRQIAILRLDTDWYESTKMEMEVLFPKVTSGGILIIDDYGAWRGARLAVDQYLADHGINLYLSRPDRSGRVAIVP